MPIFPLSHTLLFQGIADTETQAVLKCIGGQRKHYERGEHIFRVGEDTRTAGLVLCGTVHLIREDVWGNSHLLDSVPAGQTFCESYACTPQEPLMFSAVVAEEADVLFLDVGRVLTMCSSACAFHARLIRNLLAILARQNLQLTRKMEHITQKTTRKKLLSYLSFQAEREGSQAFRIPYNRQELADYLGVDRSAMSAELARMQREGILTCRRSQFTLTSLPDAASSPAPDREKFR